MPQIVRKLLLFGALAGGLAEAALAGRQALVLAVAVLLLWSVGGRFVLPRAAHRAFLAGNHGRASRYYHLLLLFFFDGEERSNIRVSLAACALGAGKYALALSRLAAIDPESLTNTGRATWENNRAYAVIRSDGDLHAALEGALRAVTLVPRMAGFRHTYGLALLSLGRNREAVTELARAWDDASPDTVGTAFESERCFNIGRAWKAQGEPEYANEYFLRSYRAAPLSTWGKEALLASTHVPAPDVVTAT